MARFQRIVAIVSVILGIVVSLVSHLFDAVMSSIVERQSVFKAFPMS